MLNLLTFILKNKIDQFTNKFQLSEIHFPKSIIL